MPIKTLRAIKDTLDYCDSIKLAYAIRGNIIDKQDEVIANYQRSIILKDKQILNDSIIHSDYERQQAIYKKEIKDQNHKINAKKWYIRALIGLIVAENVLIIIKN